MMRAFASVLLALPLLLTLSACTRDEYWHQRLTLVVDTPDGPRSALVVQRIDWQGATGLYKSLTSGLDPSQTSTRVTGEALALEVAPGRWVFALLRGDNGWQGEPGLNAGYVIAVPLGHHARSVEGVEEILAFPKDTPVILPPEAWPMLVTFDDITKPETVRRVDPADMAAMLGEGIILDEITLEVTEAAVTKGRVEGVLGADFFLKWEKRHKEELAKDDRVKNPYFQSVAAQMYRNAFIEGARP